MGRAGGRTRGSISPRRTRASKVERASSGRLASATSAWTRMLSAPCRGPLKVARAARTQASRSAPVEAATRAAKEEALSSWSAQSTSVAVMSRLRARGGLERPLQAGGDIRCGEHLGRTRSGRRGQRPSSVHTSSPAAGSPSGTTAPGEPHRGEPRTGARSIGFPGRRARGPGMVRGRGQSSGWAGRAPRPQQLRHRLESGRRVRDPPPDARDSRARPVGSR